MPSLDAFRLLGAATRLPREFQDVAEGIAVGVVVADFRPLLRADGLLSALGLRLGDFLDRVSGNVPEFVGPVERPLEGDNPASAVGVAPILAVGVGPLDDVKRFQVEGG